ncbi:hypothetical protein [Micromonospora sp. M71_S20]|nr:hypothetical protein [Micromonospora sp. M71_S20]
MTGRVGGGDVVVFATRAVGDEVPLRWCGLRLIGCMVTPVLGCTVG